MKAQVNTSSHITMHGELFGTNQIKTEIFQPQGSLCMQQCM